MSSLASEHNEPRALNVALTEESLTVDLVDGRTIIVPLGLYPRLWYGTAEERSHFEIFGDGTYIHWPDLDEDISVENLILGKSSSESQKSFKKWLEKRGKK